jgi:hypothetical protein
VRKWLWIAAAIAGGVVVLAAVVAFVLYRASQHVPEFYQHALEVEPVAQKQASDEMIETANHLVNDAKQKDHWEALFTDQQINGWLAVELGKNHPDALPPEIRDPRVSIEPEQVIVAFRLVRGDWNTVVSLALEPYVPEPNVLAVRIRKARAGALPLPLERINEAVARAALQMDLHLEWRQASGDPVALLSSPPPREDKDKFTQIEAVRLGTGEIYVSGTTRKK